MLKEKSPKLKGCICNVPIDKVDIKCKSLPQHAVSNDIVIAKLKGKKSIAALYSLNRIGLVV